MSNINKVVNKYNGNLCFVADHETFDVIFECNEDSGLLSYVVAKNRITDVCLNNYSSYYVAFNNQYIGKFYSGILNHKFINTGISNVKRIYSCADSNAIYILDSLNLRLYKYSVGLGIIWTLVLTSDICDENTWIKVRENDKAIICWNNSKVAYIYDQLTSGKIVNKVSISGVGNLDVHLTGDEVIRHSYIRYRQVIGRELDQSSSSSSSSTSSNSSSTSSLSSGSSSSSSSSTQILSWSSSSSSSSTLWMSSSSSSSTQILSWSSSSDSSYLCDCTAYSCAGGLGACSIFTASTWSFTGLNTDNSNNCTLYFKFSVQNVLGTDYQGVEIYSDITCFVLVANNNYVLYPLGTAKTIIFNAVGASGLSGSVYWNGTGRTSGPGDADMALDCVP